MQKVTFSCDICKKDFSARDGAGQILPVGGMNGFYRKMMPDKKGVIQPALLQYNLDLCADCNKKMVDYYHELGGKLGG